MPKQPKKLEDLFHATLKDIYFAEKKILATLPKMAKAAENSDLQAAFEKHRGETKGQVERLEKVFAIIKQKPQGKTCAGIVGITDEGAEIMQEYKGRCRPPRCGPGRRALRNFALRHSAHLGRRAGPP